MGFEPTTSCLGSVPALHSIAQLTTVNNLKLVERYKQCRKAERGLTPSGEEWVNNTLVKFAKALELKGVKLLEANRDDIRQFLASISSAWMRHSYFRAIRAFYNWAEREGFIELSPCYKMQAPKTPKPILPRPTLAQVNKLIETVDSLKGKAIISLLVDTGFRRQEIANIGLEDIDWQNQTVKVWGKGAKQRVGKLSNTTIRYLKGHLATYNPNSGNIWGLNSSGIQTFLRRLKLATGIPCNSHSFRRTWAIENIKRGVNLLDVQVLGGWESLEMVKHYAREVNSEDAITRYKPLMEN